MYLKNLEKNSLKSYGLCLSRYLSALALSWDAMLRMKKVKLALISDADMYLLFEKGIRDPVSYISTRFSKDRNKYLKSHYPKQE